MSTDKPKLVQDLHILNSTFHVKIYKEEERDGGYSATVQELDGCVTQGDTWEEVIENVRDAIGMYMASFDHEYELCQTLEEFLDET